MPNKIFAGPAEQQPIYVEGLAATAFGVGFLVNRDTANTLTLDTTAATVFNKEFLVSTELGQTSGVNVGDTYDAGQTAQALQASSGQYLYVRMAAGQNLNATGLGLARNGAGSTLKLAAADGTEEVVATTEEVVGTTTANQLVRVRKS